MKKDTELSNEQNMSCSISNTEFVDDKIFNSTTNFFVNNNLNNPAEILMNLILPTVTICLKDHQEIMKLKGKNTYNAG